MSSLRLNYVIMFIERKKTMKQTKKIATVLVAVAMVAGGFGFGIGGCQKKDKTTTEETTSIVTTVAEATTQSQQPQEVQANTEETQAPWISQVLEQYPSAVVRKVVTNSFCVYNQNGKKVAYPVKGEMIIQLDPNEQPGYMYTVHVACLWKGKLIYGFARPDRGYWA